MGEERVQRLVAMFEWLAASSAAIASDSVKRFGGLRSPQLAGSVPTPRQFVMSAADTLGETRRGLRSGLRALNGRWMGAMEAPQHDEVAAREMLERARSGDGDAFAEIFAIHRAGINRLCRRMMDDPASAEDATSEVFLRARRSLASYDSGKPFEPWLHKVTSNYCIDQLRRRKTEHALFSAADLSIDDLADDAPNSLLRITHREERREVLDALDDLPAKYRLPLVLRFYRDFDYDAIAEVLGVTRNQVGTLLFRAKRRLREQIVEGASRSEADPGEPDIDDGRRKRRRRTKPGRAK